MKLYNFTFETQRKYKEKYSNETCSQSNCDLSVFYNLNGFIIKKQNQWKHPAVKYHKRINKKK